MTDGRPTATLVFDDPRQAIGWLMTRWAGLLMVPLVYASMIWDSGLHTWWSAASAISAFGLGVLVVWGFWVSSDAASRLREVARQRQLSWWKRDRFGEQQAADRLGWATRLVLWTTRVLIVLAAAATLSAAAVFVSRWS